MENVNENIELAQTLTNENTDTECKAKSAAETSVTELKPKNKYKTAKFMRLFATAIFSQLLIMALFTFVMLMFVHALNEDFAVPTLWNISREAIDLFFNSLGPIVVGVSLVLIPTIIILLLNTNRIRDAFYALGLSFLASAALIFVFGYLSPFAFDSLAAEWRTYLISHTSVFNEFTSICAVTETTIGAALMSVYTCIKTVKGGNYE